MTNRTLFYQAMRSTGFHIILWLAISKVLTVLFGIAAWQVEPQTFNGPLEGIWWAAVTISTVGYGDLYPVTSMGRMVGWMTVSLGNSVAMVPAVLIAKSLMKITRTED